MMIAGTSRSHRRLVAIGLAVAGLFIAQQFISVPGNTFFDTTLNDALHLPWFFVLTWLLRAALKSWFWAILAALTLAVVSEAAQYVTARDASIGDLLRNLVGLAAAYLVWQFIYGRRRWRDLAIAVGLCAVTTAPLSFAIASRSHIASSFPVLFDATDVRDRVLARATTPTSVDADGLRLTIDGSAWPGLHLTDPVSDWSPCQSILVDVTLHDEPSMDLFVGFLLKPGDGITNFSLRRLATGRQTVRLPLKELLPDPGARVYDVFLYTTGEYEGRNLTFHRVWLSG